MFSSTKVVRALLILTLVTGLAAVANPGTANAAAAVTLSPSTGPVYTLVTINGTGFTTYDTIAVGNITFAGAPWNMDPIQIDSCGNWNIGLRVPANAVIGPNQVIVKTDAGTIASTTFTLVAPTLSISPSSGPPYTLATLTGSNFVPLDTVPVGGIKFDGLPWNSIAIPIDGTGRWSISMRVPLTAICCGAKPVLVTTSGGTVGVTSFSITAPVITMAPISGPIGTKVTICVTNMTPDGTIPAGGITFGGSPWNTSPVSIDFTGKVCSTLLTVPMAAVGGHPVVVNDGTIIATSNFTITQPTVSVTPTTAYKGQKITITGSGWPTRTPGSVSVTFAGEIIGAVTPNENGYFSMEYTVPLNADPVTLISASDVIGNTALPKALTLKGTALTLNPKSGLPGITATISGTGFQPYSGIEELKFGNTNVLTGPLMTSETGAFETTFTVPGLPAGGYTVSVKIAGVALTDCFTLIYSDALPPLPTPVTFPLKEALASISDKIIIVWGYTPETGWQMYDPNDELGSTLDVFTSGRGYWIKVTDDCSLFARSLTEGWNLLGW